MKEAPWEYLLRPFAPQSTGFQGEFFQDLFNPLWILSLIALIAQVILYNVRTRQLRRFPPLVNLQEWLLWTGIITFGLVLTMAVFRWYFLFVLITLVIGLATYVWIRFVRFPPIIEAYNNQLRRARFFSEARYKHPEATIRPKRAKRRRRA